MFGHREPRFLGLQQLLHHDNKKYSLTLSYFVDLCMRNARSDRWSVIAKLKRDIYIRTFRLPVWKSGRTLCLRCLQATHSVPRLFHTCSYILFQLQRPPRALRCVIVGSIFDANQQNKTRLVNIFIIVM